MNSASFTLPSFAKVNLLLRVLGKRPDGFHELFTVFQSVSLADSLTFSPSDKIVLTSNGLEIPRDETNIVVRAAAALRQRFGISMGAKIHLDKRIPSPAGLGGGSSNAAATLIGLSRLWGFEVTPETLEPLASQLGSDIPFFLHGGTAVGTGRGEIIETVPDFEAKWMIIAVPAIDVHTSNAFAALQSPSLTKSASKHILNVCRLELDSSDLRSSALRNDFEPGIFAAYPEIERVKATLLNLGATRALLSGSGASVFAIFDKEETRQAAMKALDRQVNWRTFAVATVSRDEYRKALKMC